ncbi:MAG: hypothetical protein Q9201_004489 [Fulgogasparrea decipioides]
MSQRAQVNALVSKLLTKFGLSESFDPAKHRGVLKDRVLQTLADAKFAKANQFEVVARLEGLEEKFRVFNNNELADALHVRLHELYARSNQWTPEVLSLLLNLSDRPLEETKINDLEQFEPPPHASALTWADIIADDPLENHDGLWDNVDFAQDSSDEDSDGAVRISSPSITPEAQGEPDGLSRNTINLLVSPDTDGLNEIVKAQFWNRAVIGADDLDGTGDVNGHSTITLTEAQVIRETGFMLLGLPTHIYEQQPNGTLTLSSGYRLKCLSPQMASRLLEEFGLLSHDLAGVREWKQKNEQSPLLQTFQDCVVRRLAVTESDLAHIQARFLRPDGSTVSLLSFLEEIQGQTRLLRQLAPILMELGQAKEAQAPFRVLELLYDRVCMNYSMGDMISFQFIAEDFFTCLRTYLKPLRHWMEQGELSQQHQDIFIQEVKAHVPLDSIWAERHRVLLDDSRQLYAPRFLHLTAKRIFNAGKSVYFLKLLGHSWPEDQAKAQDPISMSVESVCGLDKASILDSFSGRFDKATNDWIASSYNSCSALLREQLETQCGLRRILDALEYIYMFRNGHLSSMLASAIFARIDRGGDDWNDAFLLTDILRNYFAAIECINLDCLVVQTSGYSHATNNKKRSVEILNTLHVTYMLPWPIANIITKDTMSTYQRVLVFLLQIQRAKQMLECRFPRSLVLALMKDTENSRAVMLRQQMLCFVSTIFAYLTNVVLSAAISEMRQGMANADDLDGMIAVHQAYIARLNEQGLISKDRTSVLQAITSVLDLVVLFTDAYVPNKAPTASTHSKNSMAAKRPRSNRRPQEADLSSSDEDGSDVELEWGPEHIALGSGSSVVRLRKMHATFDQLRGFILVGLRAISKGGENIGIDILSKMLLMSDNKSGNEILT